jgi:hypothetical protein
MNLILGVFHEIFEGLKRIAPELVQPGAQFAKAVRIHAVDASRALGDIDDQAGFLKDLEMLRNCGPADGHAVCDRLDGARAVAQVLKHGAPGCIRKCGKGKSVRHCLR